MNKIMVMGLAGLLVLPGVGYANSVDYSNSSPTGANVSQLGQGFGSAFNNMNGLSMINGMGGLGNMNIGQMLQTAITQAVTQLTSQLLGQIGGLGGGMLGQMAGGLAGNLAGQTLSGALGQQMGMAGLSGFNTGGLTSVFGGIQGGTDSLLSSIGGAAMQGLMQAGTQAITQAITSGIQGGSGGGGSSIGGTSTAGLNPDVDVPSLNLNATVPEAVQVTTVNYRSGMIDAAVGNPPDANFLMNNGQWDADYIDGYRKALSTATQTTV